MSANELFVHGPDRDRREALLRLAAQGPISRIELPSGRSAWLVTGYAEARAMLADSRVRKNIATMAYADRLPELNAGLHQHMLNMNPPEHTRLRKLVTAAFTRRRIQDFAPRVDEICAGYLDAVARELDEGKTVDLIRGFAFPFPFGVIRELLGVGPEHEEPLRQAFVALTAGSLVSFEEYAEAAHDVLSRVQGVVAGKRDRPEDDLISALLSARDGDDLLSEDELTSMVVLLVTAGHETTTSMIGNCLLALLRHPEQLAALRAEPDRVPAAIEELLRYDNSVQTALPAVAGERIEAGGVVIEPGHSILVAIGAANLDPVANEDPLSLDVGRSAAHLSFGHGIHHCLGAPLARMELAVALRAILGRFPDLRLVDKDGGAAYRTAALIFNRLDRLDVRRPGTPAATLS